MNFIRFDCPGCGQSIEAEEDARFVRVQCPTCQHEFIPDNIQRVQPKTKHRTAWIFVALYFFAIICVASVFVWTHRVKHGAPSAASLAEDANSQAIDLQEGSLVEQLTRAAGSNDIKTVKLLLKNGADINGKDTNDWTALLYAAAKGHTDMVKLLLEKEADIHTKNSYGVTALTSAAVAGQTDVVKLLLEKGDDLNVKNNHEGNEALTTAAMAGHTDTVKFLLDNGADINAKDNFGFTALMSAAMEGHADTVKLLLDRDADINAQNTDGFTALIEAAARGRTDAVKLLLDKGADVNVKNNLQGDTALILAAGAWGQYPLFDEPRNPLELERIYTPVAELLLNKGANVNAKNDNGDTALISAARNGNIAIVKLLLAKGADINIQDNHSFTALTAAAANGQLAIDILLRQAGATDSSALGIATAAAVSSYKPAFEVLNVTAKATEKNDVWWRYGYRLTVRNNGKDIDPQIFDIQFLDAEGYVIDTATTYPKTVIMPGATAIITGEKLVSLPGAARVAKLKAIWDR